MRSPAWLVLVVVLEIQQAAVLGTKAPLDSLKHEEPYDYYVKPKYDYKYGVEDFKTGDHKSHWEKRDGDEVTGAYTVMEPDGTLRTVTYTANKKSGFNAVVTRHGTASHPQQEINKSQGHREHTAHTSEQTLQLGDSENTVQQGHRGHIVRLGNLEHTAQRVHPENSVQQRHREPTLKLEHSENFVQQRHREPTPKLELAENNVQQRHREPTLKLELGKNNVQQRHREPTLKLEHLENSVQQRHREPTLKLEHSENNVQHGHQEHTLHLAQPEHTLHLGLPEHTVQLGNLEHNIVQLEHPEVKPTQPEHTFHLVHPEHTLQLTHLEPTAKIPEHSVQFGQVGQTAPSSHLAEHPAIGVSSFHHRESYHQRPETFEQKGESHYQVSQLKHLADEEDSEESRILNNPAVNAITSSHLFARINPSAKPAPFKHQITAPTLNPIPSSSSRPYLSKQPVSTSAPARVPSYFPSSTTAPPSRIHQTFATYSASAPQTSGYGSQPYRAPSSPLPSPTPQYGYKTEPHFLSMSPSPSSPSTRPYSRTDQDGQDEYMRPIAVAEQDHGARLYRHGTQDDNQRSFVEVGMGGYPDSAYDYVSPTLYSF